VEEVVLNSWSQNTYFNVADKSSRSKCIFPVKVYLRSQIPTGQASPEYKKIKVPIRFAVQAVVFSEAASSVPSLQFTFSFQADSPAETANSFLLTLRTILRIIDRSETTLHCWGTTPHCSGSSLSERPESYGGSTRRRLQRPRSLPFVGIDYSTGRIDRQKGGLGPTEGNPRKLDRQSLLAVSGSINRGEVYRGFF
jgi:hypothetical protein